MVRSTAYMYMTLLPLRLFVFLVIPYVHVLGVVLSHVAVITLSDAPIASYITLPFLAGNLLLLLLVFIYYLLLS